MLIRNATYYDGRNIVKGDLRNGDSDEEFDAMGKFAFPAFNNGHTHLAMTLMRGAGDGEKLQEWLDNTIFPTERRLTPELVYRGSMLGLVEMIRTGTSNFLDMYYFVEETAKAVEKSGLRATLGTPITSFGTPYYKDAQDALRIAERQLKSMKPGRVGYCVAPHSIYLNDEETLYRAKELADKYNVWLTLHISETRKECVDCHEKTGMWPVEYLDSIGLLAENTVLIHAAWLTKMEIRRIADREASVIHCPVSNMKLASGGVMPLHELLDAGVTVGLGTDGASSNNSLDMREEMKIGSLLQKSHRWDATAANARTMLRMATLGSNDLAFISLDDVRMLPHHDLISNLVYSGGNVTDLIVDDRIIMKGGEILAFDEEQVKRDFLDASAELLK
ncbi:amidohydrolase family protein [Methanocella paludicola SANAE]|uniref:Amidohydrolase family protein n=1 Tax=Methanocella paludicola (strain DSM 17711 / JCM 13418 / NBRC 101707 / SANAE) TaxID=304371 RepID=D1Z0K4_METPS|nr:amidohydrolase [Methanocella paludicola]BAI62226.1 amidohydrolase family protein [Methanocella paludicola SANAE]